MRLRVSSRHGDLHEDTSADSTCCAALQLGRSRATRNATTRHGRHEVPCLRIEERDPRCPSSPGPEHGSRSELRKRRRFGVSDQPHRAPIPECYEGRVGGSFFEPAPSSASAARVLSGTFEDGGDRNGRCLWCPPGRCQLRRRVAIRRHRRQYRARRKGRVNREEPRCGARCRRRYLRGLLRTCGHRDRQEESQH
jgi:hypothetical protein